MFLVYQSQYVKFMHASVSRFSYCFSLTSPHLCHHLDCLQLCLVSILLQILDYPFGHKKYCVTFGLCLSACNSVLQDSFIMWLVVLILCHLFWILFCFVCTFCNQPHKKASFPWILPASCIEILHPLHFTPNCVHRFVYVDLCTRLFWGVFCLMLATEEMISCKIFFYLGLRFRPQLF